MTETLEAIWVISDLAPDGATYLPVVHLGEDIALPLEGDKAIAYAVTVQGAAERAAYDEIVLDQLLEMVGGDRMDVLAAAMTAMREGRPPLDDDATAPFRFEPFVSAFNRQGGIFLWVNGERYAQWTVVDARQHAAHVLQVHSGVPLDAAYRRLLTEIIQVPAETARIMVDDLGNRRKDI